jgi:hypothetical protein
MIVYNVKTNVKKECDTTTYTEDMERIVECPECGKRYKFGDGINAGNWFNEKTIWRVAICPECAERIWKDED